jgi:hypothetical protein
VSWEIEGGRGELTLDPPLLIGPIILLVCLFVWQMTAFGFYELAAEMALDAKQRPRPGAAKQPHAATSVARRRGAGPCDVPGAFTRRNQATADRPGLA